MNRRLAEMAVPEPVKRLRIAYIDSAHGLGGAEHLLLNLIEGLPREEIEPLLFCDPDGAFGKSALGRGITTVDFQSPAVVSLSSVIGQMKILNPAAVLWDAACLVEAACRLGRRLKAANIDIVQTNSAFAHIYGGLAARIAGLPCTWYFHDLVETRRFHGAGRKIWQILAARLACRVVCVCDAAIDALGIRRKSEVIHACYSGLQPFEGVPLRERLNLHADSKVVGYIGRIAYVKGLDILIKAAAHIVVVDPACHVVVVGEPPEGEQSYGNALASQVTESGLAGHWHWLGYQPDASRLISEFDLLVLPSRREAFPLVLLEAAVAKRAVVASNVGGVSEAIAEGQTGYLVRPESPDELAAAILRLLASPALREKMGAAAGQKVRQQFNPGLYFSRFLELYRSLSKRD